MHEFVGKEKMAASKGDVVKKRYWWGTGEEGEDMVLTCQCRILLAAARRPAKGKFVIPYKGGAPVVKRLTKALHNPLEKDALVLFKPQDLFSEKYDYLIPFPRLSSFYSHLVSPADSNAFLSVRCLWWLIPF